MRHSGLLMFGGALLLVGCNAAMGIDLPIDAHATTASQDSISELPGDLQVLARELQTQAGGMTLPSGCGNITENEQEFRQNRAEVLANLLARPETQTMPLTQIERIYTAVFPDMNPATGFLITGVDNNLLGLISRVCLNQDSDNWRLSDIYVMDRNGAFTWIAEADTVLDTRPHPSGGWLMTVGEDAISSVEPMVWYVRPDRNGWSVQTIVDNPLVALGGLTISDDLMIVTAEYDWIEENVHCMLNSGKAAGIFYHVKDVYFWDETEYVHTVEQDDGVLTVEYAGTSGILSNWEDYCTVGE